MKLKTKNLRFILVLSIGLSLIFSPIFVFVTDSSVSADSISDKKSEKNLKNTDEKLSTKPSPLMVLGSIFGIKETKSKYQEVSLPKNTQTLSLLQAPKNIDPQAKAQAPLQVVDDSALGSDNIGVNGSQILNTEFKPTSDQISLYVVRAGDTLEQVAQMYDVTANTIRWANDIGAKESIQPGQVLVILPVAGVKYTVKKGDTINKIAKAYGVDANETANFNNVSANETLKIGMSIIIPDAEGSFGPGHSASTPKPGTKPTKPTGSVNTAGFFGRPVNGAVRTQGLHGNNGIDFGAALNTPIYAAAAGEVIVSRSGGWNGGYGTYVVIKHSNGTQTLYAHMNQALVSVGDKVVKGQQIGKMGSTGQSTGVHLHFEVRGGKNPF